MCVWGGGVGGDILRESWTLTPSLTAWNESARSITQNIKYVLLLKNNSEEANIKYFNYFS